MEHFSVMISRTKILILLTKSVFIGRKIDWEKNSLKIETTNKRSSGRWLLTDAKKECTGVLTS